MGLFGKLTDGGSKDAPSTSNLLHISYNDETWHSYTLPKKPQKNMNQVTHPLRFTDIGIFLQEIRKFCNIKKFRYRLHFGTNFLLLLTYFEF